MPVRGAASRSLSWRIPELEDGVKTMQIKTEYGAVIDSVTTACDSDPSGTVYVAIGTGNGTQVGTVKNTLTVARETQSHTATNSFQKDQELQLVSEGITGGTPVKGVNVTVHFR